MNLNILSDMCVQHMQNQSCQVPRIRVIGDIDQLFAVLSLYCSVQWKHARDLTLRDAVWVQVVSVEELSDVVEHRLGCSPNFKYFYDPETKTYQGRPHQYNCTYFSALGGNARHYLLARAIQFFTPGIPMVYYVGLFAGLNDYDVSLYFFQLSTSSLPAVW